MTGFTLIVYVLKFMIPSLFAILFRAFGLGYRNRSRLILGLAVFLVYMVTVPSVLITVMGYGQYTHIVALVMTIGAMAALLFSSDPPDKTILLILIVAQMNSVISVPLNMVRHLLHLTYLQLDLMLLLVCMFVYWIALRFWAKPLRFLADHIHGRLTAPILIPIVITALIYAIPVYPARNFEFHPVYCTVMMMTVELVFFLYLYTLYHSLRQISDLSSHKFDAEILQLSAASMAERLQMMDEAAYQSSLVSHDRRHFNSMVLELLEQGQSEEAITILRRQTEAVQPKGRRYCENHVVNAAASYYTALAEQQGIGVDIQLDIPNVLAVDSLELAVTLSNLLENAIQGCEELPKNEIRNIQIVCRHVGRLILEISNPCAEDMRLDKHGYPSTQCENHGLGTKSVLAFVGKYAAEIFYRIENGVFTVRLLV